MGSSTDKPTLSKQAARALYDAYYDRVYQRLLAVVRDEEWAKDLTQEAFTRAFERFDQLRSGEKFGFWVYLIGLNFFRDQHRKHGRETPVDPQSHPALTTLAVGKSVEESAIKNEAIASLVEAFKSLPVAYREVVVLFYVDELSIAEISDAIGVPEGTVKSRLFRGRKILHDAISWGEPQAQ